MESVNTKLFYTPKEFSKILGCSSHTCYDALHQRKIRSFRLGLRYFIPASEVERLSQSVAAENNDVATAEPDLW